MDIFDRSWCNLYIWTPEGGSGVYHIRRDRAYWAAAFDVLAEFWWGHDVPARQAYERGAVEEVEQYRPGAKHPATERLKAWSKSMAAEAPATFFSPQQQQERQVQ